MIEVTVPMSDAIVSRIEALADEADRVAYLLEWLLAEEGRIIDEWSAEAHAADPSLDYQQERGNLWWNRYDPHLGRLEAAFRRAAKVIHEDGRFEPPAPEPTGPTYDWWVPALGKMASELAETNENWAAALAYKRAGGQ